MLRAVVLITMVLLAGGCATAHPNAHRARTTDHPAVVPLVQEHGERALVGSGVPRPGGRVITALHVVGRGFPVPAGDCGPVREITFHRHHTATSEPDADDIAWIRASCRFERTDQITSAAPPIGTRVTLAGYPGAVFSGGDFASGSIPPPCVVEGTVIDEPGGLPFPASGVVWVEIAEVWSEFMPGFSGGPCAYKDESGEWVVFGVGQFRLGDEVWSFLGIDLPFRPGSKRAVVAIAPIPDDWTTEDHTPSQ